MLYYRMMSFPFRRVQWWDSLLGNSPSDHVQLPLKVAINPHTSKVLFVEVNSDLLDVLLSFMTLPLGKIVRLFQEHYKDKAPALGSLYTLYQSVSNLDSVYFGTSEAKKMLLNPRSTFSDDCCKLKINLDDSGLTKYFTCDRECGFKNNTVGDERYSDKMICLYFREMICECRQPMRYQTELKDSNTVVSDGVFVKRANSNFTITEGMQIVKTVSISIIHNLCGNGAAANTVGIEEKTLQLRRNEIIDLLKGLMVSNTPLTDLVFNKGVQGQTNHSVTNHEFDTLLKRIKQLTGPNSEKIYLEAAMQKSTGKLLYAQAGDRFVDFLFSILTIPLGGVAKLLNGNTCLGAVDNYYRSLESFNFKTKDMKSRLIGPSLPYMYLSSKQILPITEQKKMVYYHFNVKTTEQYLAPSFLGLDILARFRDPKGSERCYVKRGGMFMVTDDLTVTPLSPFSIMSHLNGLGVGLSDVNEVKVEIGVEEALIILKECLTSTAVLTKVVKHATLKKQPKQQPLRIG